MKARNAQTGEVVEVSTEEAARLYQSGGWSLPTDATIPMRSVHGSLVAVPVEELPTAAGAGYAPASEQEWLAADREARYGSPGQVALTAAEGAASGLTLGTYGAIADTIDEDYAKEYLARQETNPVASVAGEVVGTVAPLLASGGTSGVASGARVLGAAPRAAARLGMAAERGAARVLGTEAASVLGRAAQRGGAMAVGGAVEALPSAVGRQVSRAMIEDREILSEQVLAGIGLEALVGGVAGGVLGGGVSMARDGAAAASRAFGHVAPGLERRIAEASAALTGKSADDIVGAWRGRRALGEADAVTPTQLADEITGLRAAVDDARAVMRETPEVVEPMGRAMAAVQKLEDAGVIVEGRANARAVGEYLGSVTNPATDVVHSQLRAIAREADDAAKAAAKVAPSPAIEALQTRIASVSKALDGVEAGTIARNQFDAIATGGDNGGAMIKGMMGSMIGGAPGAAIGTVIGTLSRPADVIGKVASIERIARMVDARIEGGVRGYLAKVAHSPVTRAAVRTVSVAKPPKRESPEKTYEKALKRIEEPPEIRRSSVEHSVRNVREVSPEVADSIVAKVDKATEFLATKLPAAAVKRPLTPQLDKGTPAKSELRKFQRYALAVEDPTVIVRELAAGTLTTETVEAVREVYPALYERVRNVAIEGLAKMKTPPPYQARMRLGLLLGFEADPSLNPTNMVGMQSSKMLNPPPPQTRTSISGSPAKSLSERMATELDRVEGVLS